MRDRPEARTLRELAAAGDAPEATRALALAIAAREARAGAAPVEAWAARLAALYDAAAAPEALERRLAAELRAGTLDDGPRRAAVRAHLIATVRAKLAEIDPVALATWPILDGGLDGAAER
jgi:hypothetical protein